MYDFGVELITPFLQVDPLLLFHLYFRLFGGQLLRQLKLLLLQVLFFGVEAGKLLLGLAEFLKYSPTIDQNACNFSPLPISSATLSRIHKCDAGPPNVKCGVIFALNKIV
jgi:hypothetical protein